MSEDISEESISKLKKLIYETSDENFKRKFTLTGLSNKYKKSLKETGKKLGFKTDFEWKIRSGLIDVVWYIERKIFGRDVKIPIAGFEIETSNRTRKHIKGDLFNLKELNAPISVVLLLETGFREKKKFDSLLKFSKKCIKNERNTIILTEKDIDLIIDKN